MTAAPAGTLTLRVTVADAWEVFGLETGPGDTIGALKRRGLEAAHVDPARAGLYAVKVGGALVADETRTLANLGVPDNAPLVILFRRRRPVR